MGDWPQVQDSNRIIITPGSIESCGVELKAQAATPAAGAWQTANLAIFIPFVIYTPWLAQKMFILNGGTVSGNVDVGICDDQGHLLVSNGSTAQSGINANQIFNITDTLLLPGVYYKAISMDNTTGTLRRFPVTAPGASICGVLTMASAFPLPDPITFASGKTLTAVPDLAVVARTTV